MKSSRIWLLLGAAILLGLWYVSSFTEWLRTEPIEIIAQFRPLPKELLARRASRGPADKGEGRPQRIERVEARESKSSTAPAPSREEGARAEGGPGTPPDAKAMKTLSPRSPGGESGAGARGGLGLGKVGGRNLKDIQPFVFSLDGRYRLTGLKVVETSSTNATPPIAWWVRSKTGSPPTDNILYGRAPESLVPLATNSRPDKLLPGRTYTLYVEAGRRRGQKSFSVPQEAEPVPSDDGDYHPEKDIR